MATDKLNELTKSLTSASPAQLKEIRAKINGLLELGASSPAVKTDDWLWDGLVEELSSRGLLHAGAVGSLQRTKAFRTYTAKAGAVRVFLLRAAPGLPQKQPVLQALGRRVAYCLAEAVSVWAPLSPSFLLTNIDKVPEAVDQCFPGYAAAGLLDKLVKVA